MALFATIRCPLCHTFHETAIHAYPERKVRSPETMENETILIFVIICKTAQKAGKPYTMRVIPEFLSPYCVIRQDKALEVYKELENSKVTSKELEGACHKLGCHDPRTAAKHINRTQTKLESVVKQISEYLSHSYFNLPQIVPDAGLFCMTEILTSALYNCFTKQFGKIVADKYFSILDVISYFCQWSDFSTTFVFKTIPIQDTS